MKSQSMVAALISILVLAACAGNDGTSANTAASPTAGTAGETKPAVVRIGSLSSPDSLNPGAGQLASANDIFGLVYDSMFQLQFDGSYTSELAQSVDVSADGLVWTFTLRDGVVFHDGEPLTAKDVAFTYSLYQNSEEFPALFDSVSSFASVTAPDDHTVVLTLNQPVPDMQSKLIELYILPEHIWSKVEHPGSYENLEMIGSGPFKLKDYSQSQYVDLVVVKDHVPNPPRIDEVIFTTYGSGDPLVQALRTGEVDMITGVPAAALVGLRSNPNIKVAVGPPLRPAVTDIMVDVIDPGNCPPGEGVCSGHPALRDRNVRLALAHATDKQQIIDIVRLGLGSPGLTLVPDSLGPYFDGQIQDYAFDIDKANSILDDAGYRDTDGDGVREMPGGGQPLLLRMNWPGDEADAARMAALLAANWEKIGVQTEQAALDPELLYNLCCLQFDYDLILWGWDTGPDPDSLLRLMTSDGIAAGGSDTGYSNPHYDDLYNRQAIELDQTKRLALIHEMQEIVHHDLPYIVPFYNLDAQAYRTDRYRGWPTDAGRLALQDRTSLVGVEPVR